MPDAARLICAVRDRDATEAHETLQGLDKGALMRLAVLLADMVPDDAPLVPRRPEPPPNNDDDIYGVAASIACREYDITLDDLHSRAQNNDVAKARHLTWWLCRQRGLSLSTIGRYAGRDHTTVMSGVRRVERDPVMVMVARSLLGRRALSAA